SIPVESQPTGTVAANAFAGFTNPTGRVFKTNYWGASGIKYLKADDYKQYVVTTTINARDVEVTSWGAVITMFLRLSKGRALYVTWNYEVSKDGQLEIGIVTDLSEGHEFRQNGTYHSLWSA